MLKTMVAASLLLVQLASAGSPSSVTELIAVSVADFHANPTLWPTDFRSVRAGSIGTDGGDQLVLCGEALLTSETAATWTAFATLQTSHYEQWLGGSAVAMCQQPSIEWRVTSDLAQEMREVLAALSDSSI